MYINSTIVLIFLLLLMKTIV